MIVDAFMPCEGLEAIRPFHERAPTVPLVAISGYAFADMAQACHAARRDAPPAKAFQARRPCAA